MYHFFKLLSTLVQSLSYTIKAKQRGKNNLFLTDLSSRIAGRVENTQF